MKALCSKKNKKKKKSIKTYYARMKHCNPRTSTENTYIRCNTALRDDQWCSDTLKLWGQTSIYAPCRMGLRRQIWSILCFQTNSHPSNFNEWWVACDDKKISSFRGGVSCRARGQLLAFLTTQMLCKSAVLKKQNLYSKETQPEISANWISISVFFLFFFCLYCVLSPTGLTTDKLILFRQGGSVAGTIHSSSCMPVASVYSTTLTY